MADGNFRVTCLELSNMIYVSKLSQLRINTTDTNYKYLNIVKCSYVISLYTSNFCFAIPQAINSIKHYSFTFISNKDV